MRSYEEICEELRTAEPGKQARKLHKELKAYGDGLSFLDRYPNAPWLLVIPTVFAVIGAIWAIGLLISALI